MTCARFLLSLAFCFSCLSLAAEPDWPAVEDHAVGLLQRYVRLRSVNPPADTRATANLLAAEFRAAGLDPKIYETDSPGKVNLLVRLPGKDHDKKPLLLLNHMDVVPVDAARWTKKPFGAEIIDGSLWGRGSLDMKSTAIAQLTALLELKKLGVVPPRDILFLSTCDEETDGLHGAGWMIAHHWAELDPEYVLDEGGIGSSDLYSPGKTVFGISVGDKQVLWLKMRASGTSGHASQPIPDNANDILIAAIAKAKDFKPSGKPNAVVEQMRSSIGEFAPNKFMNAMVRNTMSLTTLRSGVGDPPKVNVIPSVAEATLDCRLLPGQNAQEFLSEIKARVNDPRVTFEQLSRPADPGPSRIDTPLFQALVKAIHGQDPDAVVVPTIIPYGTDTQKFRLRGVTGYGLMPFKVDAATIATMHSDSEHIALAEFKRGLRIYFDILNGSW